MLETGYEEIDTEHKEVVDDANRVFKAIKTENVEKISGELTNFIEKTRKHFISEEKLMERYKLPELAAHRKLHEKLLQLSSDIITGFKADQSPSKLKKDFKMLCNYMTKHIINYDQPILKKIIAIQQSSMQ